MFERRALLQGSHLSIDAYFLGATREAGEPTVLEGPTVWYRWTAPEDGYLQLGAPGFIYPGVYLFEGTEVGSLNYLLQFVGGVTKTHQVQGGKEYAIAVVSPGPNADGTFTPVVWTLEFSTGPVNDLLANSKLVAGDLVETNELALGVTQQGGEPFPAVWWTWIAPADGRVNLLLNGGWNLNFYTGTKAAPTLLWASPHPQTTGVIDVEAGKAYHIAVHSLHQWAGFQLRLERRLSGEGIHEGKVYRQGDAMDVTFGGVPEGEVITNLFVYVNSIGPILETNRMAPLHVGYLPAGGFMELSATARAESGKDYYFPKTIFHVHSPQYFFGELPQLTDAVVELSANMEGSAQNFAENIQWWRWTAPISGIIHGEHLSGPGLNWALFKGTDPAALQPVPNWTVEAGSAYVIQASSIRSSGTYRFSILRTPPVNDLFANATVLDTSAGWEPVLVGNATTDPGEEGTAPSVWYVFTAPTDGVMTFGGGVNFFLTTTIFPITVAKDAAIDELVPMTALDGGHQFAAEAGQTYRMRVQSAFASGHIPYVFFHFAPRIENDDMAEAQVLAGDHLSFELVLAGAGSETNEPLNWIGMIPQRTAWYEWTAPYAGFVAVRVPEALGSGGPVVDIDIFEGEPLSPVPLKVMEGEARFFHAEEGTKYLLRFSDFSGLWTNRVTAYLDLSPFALENGGPPKPVALEPIQLSLPAEVTEVAALSIRYKVSEWHGGAYRWGEWRELTNIVAAPFEHTVTDLVVGNHTIYAVVTNVNGTVSYLPPMELRLRPENDDYENRIELIGRKIFRGGSTVNGTLETSEPAIGVPAANASVWYTWTARAAAPTTIKVSGEHYLRVFEGDSFGNLQPLPVQNQQQITFIPMEGRTYQIAVASVTTNPPQDWTTFGLSLEMSPFTLLQPVNGSVFEEGESIITAISTPERPEVIVNTQFRFANPSLPIQGYVTNAPRYLPSVTWPNLAPGSYTVTAAVTFDTGETMSRNSQIRIRPRNVIFSNATVLEGVAGNFRPTTLGADATANRRATNWFRFSAATNGHLIIATTNNGLSSPQIGATELKVTVGTATDALTAVPHIGNVQLDRWVAVPVTAGTTYNLQFTIEAERMLPALKYYVVPWAGNDLFEDAEVILGTSAEMKVATRFATNQVGEPAHFGAATRTLWWKWESPAEPGYVTYSGRAKFYSGSELTNLTALPAAFYVAEPTTFYIATEGPVAQVESEWKFEFNPSPANDDFADSTVLEGRRALMDADLRYATGEPGEGEVHPAGYIWGRTVWYRWTAPMGGQMVLRRLHAFPVVAVFRGTTFTNLTWFQPNSEGIYNVEQGETLHISLDSPSEPFAVMELLLMVPPPNDLFTNPLVLRGRNATASSWNFGATRELGEVRHNGQLGGRSVWFEWVAPEDGPARVKLRGDISTNLLAVYRGESIAQLVQVVGGSGVLTNEVQFEASVGQRYRIAVDGAFGASGDFDVSIELLTPVAPLRIAGIEIKDGMISFEFEGGSAGAELQRSINLVDWETIQTINGVGQVEIDAGGEMPAAFFRVVVP